MTQEDGTTREQATPPGVTAVARRAYEALSRAVRADDPKDWEAFRDVLADDLEFIVPIPRVLPGPQRGKEARDRWIAFHRDQQQTRVETELLHEHAIGDTVAVEFRSRGTLFDTPYVNQIVMFLRVSGGKVVELREYSISNGWTPDGRAWEPPGR